jgi:hypothetical protein
MKHLLYISNGTSEGKLLLSKKSASFRKLFDVLDIMQNDFEIIQNKDKFDFFEMVILILNDLLLNRIEPKLPENLYMPEEQFYCKKNIFGKEYNFIYGSEGDNDILQLIVLKDLVRIAIQENLSLTGKFIDKKFEAFR